MATISMAGSQGLEVAAFTGGREGRFFAAGSPASGEAGPAEGALCEAPPAAGPTALPAASVPLAEGRGDSPEAVAAEADAPEAPGVTAAPGVAPPDAPPGVAAAPGVVGVEPASAPPGVATPEALVPADTGTPPAVEGVASGRGIG
ncbi:MAG: hypothetical protein FJX76_06030 [Armatimonadetes bacterium]|nr:hypothetical protein [Armatimonadota bacterium]